jgi:hypothetical protein
MRELKVGSEFTDSYMTWEVCDRHENYALLTGKQRGAPQIWVTANISNEGSSEICRPLVTNSDPGSAIYSQERMTVLFNAEVEKIKIRNSGKLQAIADKLERDKFLRESASKADAAKARINDLILKLQELIKESKDLDSIIKNKDFVKASTELSMMDNILKFGIRKNG